MADIMYDGQYLNTPIAGHTPHYQGGMTDYSVANTPNPGGFSPGPNMMQSPYMSPYPGSPGYGTG